MKFKQILTLMMAVLTLCTTLACTQSELIPTAQALFPLDDGTVLDPGSHGLIVENIDSKLLTKKADILKALKASNESFEEEYYEHYQDYVFWEVTVKVKNNFPVDLYGINLMLHSYTSKYTYFERWWEYVGYTIAAPDESYLPKGFDFGEVIMKPGETFSHTFYYYTCADGSGLSPQYLRLDWIEFWTEDDFFMEQDPQISPYFELDNHKKAAKALGGSNQENPDHTAKFEVTDVALIPADPKSVLKDTHLSAGSYSVFADGFSKEDVLLELKVTVKNISDEDISNPQLDLLFYNKDGNMVRHDYNYQCTGNIAAKKEATLSAGYYYAEDPYYIPHTVKEIGGSKTFKTPVTLYRYADLSAEATAVAAGAYHTAYIKADGTVGTAGRTSDDRCKVEGWMDIVAVDSSSHTVGLKSDGTVVATGPNGKKQCNVSKWEDIIAIAAGAEHTLGLKSDGTVVAVGNSAKNRLNVSDWKNIIAIDAGSATTYGLKADGSVVATGSNSSGQAKITHWDDIVAISAGDRHVVGLKSDGTVVAAGGNSFRECDVESWTDIVAVAAGSQFTVGLKSDGTVVAVGNNEEGQCDVKDWTNIAAINAGMHHVIGVRADGSYITAGSNGYGQCDLK